MYSAIDRPKTNEIDWTKSMPLYPSVSMVNCSYCSYLSLVWINNKQPIYCFPILLISGKGVSIAKKNSYCHPSFWLLPHWCVTNRREQCVNSHDRNWPTPKKHTLYIVCLWKLTWVTIRRSKCLSFRDFFNVKPLSQFNALRIAYWFFYNKKMLRYLYLKSEKIVQLALSVRQ